MAHTEDEVRGWIGDVLIPGGGVYLVETEGQVVAMLAVSHDQDGSWIDQLYVRPGYTGRGIGARLLRLAHERLRPPIRLFTFQANSGARRFYERQGYKAVQFTDGAGNEERCPDVLYEWRGAEAAA
jgi:GNAT superfamily N-acetyltransferase